MAAALTPSAPSAPQVMNAQNLDEMSLAELEEYKKKITEIWKEKALPIIEEFGEFFTDHVKPSIIDSVKTFSHEGSQKIAPEKFGSRPLPMHPNEMDNPVYKGKLANQCPFIIVKLLERDLETGNITKIFTEIIFRCSLQSDNYSTTQSYYSNVNCNDSYIRESFLSSNSTMSENEMRTLGSILKGNTVLINGALVSLG